MLIPVRFGVLLLLCLASLILYAHRGFGVAAAVMQIDLQLTDRQLGWSMTAFYATYAFLQVPASWIGQRLGWRIALAAAVAGCSLLMGLSGAVGGFLGLVLARLGMGTLQAGFFPGATASLAGWFPIGQRAFTSGSLGASMFIGAAGGAWFTTRMIEPLGWRLTFALLAFPGLIWAVLWGWWFRNQPADHPFISSAELAVIDAGRPSPASRVGSDVRTLAAMLLSPTMWLVCAQQACRAGANVFYLTWFTRYLIETRGLSHTSAGELTALPLLAGILGSLLGGSVSDFVLSRTGSHVMARRGVAVGSLMTGVTLIVIASFTPHTLTMVLLIGLGGMVVTFASPCSYALTIDMGGRDVAPAFGLMNTAGNTGAMTFPIAVTYLVDASSGDWHSALELFAGLYWLAAVLWLIITPGGTFVERSLLRR